MAISITEQNGRIYVRRWSYSKEKGRSVPTTVYNVKRYKLDDTLPKDVITEHSVTKEEQQQFAEFISNFRSNEEIRSKKASMLFLPDYLAKAKQLLEDKEIEDDTTLSEYEELSALINDVKKLVTSKKNALKLKERRSKATKV